MIPAIFKRIALHFKLPRSSLSEQDQTALAKVTARITGIHQTQYTLGLFDTKGEELKCRGYARMPVGESFVGEHTATFGPFPHQVTVAGAMLFAPVTGDLISRVDAVVAHTAEPYDMLRFLYSVHP